MHAMAKALLEWETIDSDQIDDIMAASRRAAQDWTPPARVVRRRQRGTRWVHR